MWYYHHDIYDIAEPKLIAVGCTSNLSTNFSRNLLLITFKNHQIVPSVQGPSLGGSVVWVFAYSIRQKLD